MNSKTKFAVSVQVICSLLIFLFVCTGISKLLDLKSFQLSLHASPLINDKNLLVSWTLPIVDLATALLLLLLKTKHLELVVSFLLKQRFFGGRSLF